jgi:hypothetical protein
MPGYECVAVVGPKLGIPSGSGVQYREGIPAGRIEKPCHAPIGSVVMGERESDRRLRQPQRLEQLQIPLDDVDLNGRHEDIVQPRAQFARLATPKPNAISGTRHPSQNGAFGEPLRINGHVKTPSPQLPA